MAQQQTPQPTLSTQQFMPPKEALAKNLSFRQRLARVFRNVLLIFNVFAIVMLVLVLLNIVNRSSGLSVVKYVNAPSAISPNKPYSQLTSAEIAPILVEKVDRARLRVLALNNVIGNVPFEQLSGRILKPLLPNAKFPTEVGDATRFNELEENTLARLLVDNVPRETLIPAIETNLLAKNNIAPSTFSETPLADLTSIPLRNALRRQPLPLLREFALQTLFPAEIPREQITGRTLDQLLTGKKFAPELGKLSLDQLTSADYAALLTDNLSQGALVRIVERDVIKPTYPLTFALFESVLDRGRIEKEAVEKYPQDTLVWKTWIDFDFISSELTGDYSTTGMRMALFGSIFVILLTTLFALPIGVGAAIYLEEYARKNWLTTFIETNIRNLAGVPSIIYGILGLAVFVRFLFEITSGRFLGIADASGRSILSAALTMSLLILPVVIISAQEALRAVPRALRESSYGVGATQWQTISKVVMPSAVPGIMTGLILALSRAVGETAPLLVVGGLTFVTQDPNSIFSKFTVIPIQVYSWTSEGEYGFKSVAAAAIIVLMVLLLSLNLVAITIRQRFSRRLRAV